MLIIPWHLQMTKQTDWFARENEVWQRRGDDTIGGAGDVRGLIQRSSAAGRLRTDRMMPRRQQDRGNTIRTLIVSSNIMIPHWRPRCWCTPADLCGLNRAARGSYSRDYSLEKLLNSLKRFPQLSSYSTPAPQLYRQKRFHCVVYTCPHRQHGWS